MEVIQIVSDVSQKRYKYNEKLKVQNNSLFWFVGFGTVESVGKVDMHKQWLKLDTVVLYNSLVISI